MKAIPIIMSRVTVSWKNTLLHIRCCVHLVVCGTCIIKGIILDNVAQATVIRREIKELKCSLFLALDNIIMQSALSLVRPSVRLSQLSVGHTVGSK